MLRRIPMIASLAVVLSIPQAGSWAWLYDGGPPQHAGVMVREDSSVSWAAAPFFVQQESYADTFGAALGRALGPVDAGFTVYLAPGLDDVVGSAMASVRMIPTTSALEYYYQTLDTPVTLLRDRLYYLVFVPDEAFWGSVSYCLTGYRGWGSPDYGYTWSVLQYPLCVRVDGTPVPEPLSALVLVAAFAGLRVISRRTL